MTLSFPVQVRNRSESFLAHAPADAVKEMETLLEQGEFELVITDAAGVSFTAFGQKAACILVREAQGQRQIFCLSKRKQTPRSVEAFGRSESHLHHQVLQEDDIRLICTCLLEGQPVPDAYHVESIG